MTGQLIRKSYIVAKGHNSNSISSNTEKAIIAGLSQCSCKLLYRDNHGKHKELLQPRGIVKMGRGTYCSMHLERYAPTLSRDLAPNVVDSDGIDRINLYISPPRCGAAMHFDSRCVVVVQLSGTKVWQIGMQPAVEEPLCNTLADEVTGEAYYNGELIPLPDRMHFVFLHPGDWLMIPAGTWHGTYSLHGSVSATLAFSEGSDPTFTSEICADDLAGLVDGGRLLC